MTPHFWNLNEDPALTGMVVHLCPDGTTAIGNGKAKKAPGILMKGLKYVNGMSQVNAIAIFLLVRNNLGNIYLKRK